MRKRREGEGIELLGLAGAQLDLMLEGLYSPSHASLGPGWDSGLTRSEAGLRLEDQSDPEDSVLLPTQDQGPQLKVAEKFPPIRKLTDSHDADFKSLWKR